MLVYEKKVEGERHLFGTMGNIPSNDDVQLTYKDEDGATASPTLQDTFLDDGHGGIKMIHNDTESELNVFIGDVNIIPGDFEALEFTVTVTAGENGTATADKNKAKAGETVTLTITPAENYVLDKVEGVEVDKDNKFIMPASNVSITVTFEAA